MYTYNEAAKKIEELTKYIPLLCSKMMSLKWSEVSTYNETDAKWNNLLLVLEKQFT